MRVALSFLASKRNANLDNLSLADLLFSGVSSLDGATSMPSLAEALFQLPVAGEAALVAA